ncbi:MAG: hypothetical protein GTO63_09620 [Anaerolineae bacterium]|nr:hypothetical protein [Anaerolineae bacterium]NIN95142.1 hypothetical protein [Anaerolineae bacterium]NIQ78994.1 hypothetical protein [Anaerolineae bacterium]
MSTTCRFFYEDSHRRSPRKECLLIGRNPDSEPWQDGLCRTCPVPDILETNPCANLALEAEVASHWGLFRRVKVFAVCTVKLERIANPANCRRGCSQFEGLF